jgi:hypothetical protein
MTYALSLLTNKFSMHSYGGGTRPWGTNSPSYETPRTDDGLIEVIGLTTYQLVCTIILNSVYYYSK